MNEWFMARWIALREIALSAGLVLTLVGTLSWGYWTSYRDGLHSTRSDLAFYACCLLVAVTCLVASAVWCVALFTRRRTVVPTPNGTYLANVHPWALLALLIALMVSWSLNPGSCVFLRGLRANVLSNLDRVASIREWRESVSDEGEVPPEKWPRAVEDWPPNRVFVEPGNSTFLQFGDGFGHWGIFIGDDIQTAELDGWLLPATKGVWVWHERQ